MRKTGVLCQPDQVSQGGSAAIYRKIGTEDLTEGLAERRMLSESLSDGLKTVKFLN